MLFAIITAKPTFHGSPATAHRWAWDMEWKAQEGGEETPKRKSFVRGHKVDEEEEREEMALVLFHVIHEF